MEYQIGEFAKLSGLSTRTLRYYDEIGLLTPYRVSESGYRIYHSSQTDRLQQILFFRALDMPLEDIAEVLQRDSFNTTRALEEHLQTLLTKRRQLEELIQLAKDSLKHQKGEVLMKDAEKFTAFKQGLIDENERAYGPEIRKAYGKETIEASNAKLLGLSEEQMKEMDALTKEIGKKLAEACQQGDPKSPLAREVAKLHKQWLSFTWPSYSKEQHLGLVALYTETLEFTEYYDAYGVGCTAFLRKAVEHYLAE